MQMNYKILIIMLVMSAGLYGFTQPENKHHRKNKRVDIVDVMDNQIHQLLVQLNEEFDTYENNNPQKGYCVTINTKGSLQGKITPHGGRRSTKLLSDMPENELIYKEKCPFCKYAKNKSDSCFLKDFHDQSYAVTSLSNQILVIPQEHYTHLFTAPFDMQVIIIKNMLAMRSQHPEKIERPMEFHCGSAAGQTVFHLHGRTGLYIK